MAHIIRASLDEEFLPSAILEELPDAWLKPWRTHDVAIYGGIWRARPPLMLWTSLTLAHGYRTGARLWDYVTRKRLHYTEALLRPDR